MHSRKKTALMPQSRRTRIVLAVLATLFVIPALALAVLLNVDWNRAKPWLNGRTSDAIGRPFAIRGDLSLSWEKAASASSTKAWHNLIPWPHLVARDVHVGSPAGMTDAAGAAPELASVSQFSFSLDPLALLHQTIAIPELRFDAPRVALRRLADGRNNWTFDQKDKSSPWALELGRVVFTKGSVHLNDAQQHADVDADVDTINADPRYGVAWTLQGRYNGEPVSGSGKAGAVLSLQRQDTPFPIAANVRVGATAISVEGTLTKPTALAALDMRLKVSGATLASLYPLTGLVLPETPPFSTEGHLLGSLGAQGSHWTYEKFSGKVGSSDIGGSLDYQARQPRGLLTGTVTSRLLQLSDLGPIIGADSDASKAARGDAAAQPAGKVLPAERFKTERWTSIDADVHYAAEKITSARQLPISDLSTHLTMRNGVIALTPLNFGIAGGTLASNIRLDASGRIDKKAIRAEMKSSARHLKIKRLFPALKGLQASVGEINADASLSATGDSVASLLGTSNGEVRSLIDHGTVSKLLLEEMGLNIGSVVLTTLFGDKQVKLNCMATDFAVDNGVMQARSFIVDTDEAILKVSGHIDLAQERLDLTINPDSKGVRVFSLRAPLYVRGSFMQPAVSVDKGVLALRAGGAAALAVLAPIAALIPLVNAGPGDSSACAKLLTDARVTPLAPPPGKTMRRQGP